MDRVYIGLGTNQGNALKNIKTALQRIDMHPYIAVERVAGLYLTEPIGYVEQEWFHNTVAEITTFLQPSDLLDVLLQIELELGRMRVVRWGPRTIDLDILLYTDGRVIDLPELTIPHPRILERAFVTSPLLELAPDLEIKGKQLLRWDKDLRAKQKILCQSNILW